MEMETEVWISEGLTKRGRLDPQVETITTEERLASEEKFWDDLLKEAGARPMRKESDHMEGKMAWVKKDLAAKSREAASAVRLPEDDRDEPGYGLMRFRHLWNDSWSGTGRFGDFEDTTLIPNMRYTDNKPPCDERGYCDTIEIYSVEIAGIGEGLQWPLNVFGLIAMRDCIDRNRNIIFQRSSVNCQTLTEKDPNLVLTGPTRSVVFLDPIFIEVDLKVKGTSEDKTLFCRVLPIRTGGMFYSTLEQITEISKFSTLKFSLGHIFASLEATIFVRVVDGSWPDGFHGLFAACMVVDEKRPGNDGANSVNNKEVVLHSFGAEERPVIGDGDKIKLSRCVVCVQYDRKLEVSVKAWQDFSSIIVDKADFTTKESGKSCAKVEVASCKMEITVAWSIVSSKPEVREETINEK